MGVVVRRYTDVEEKGGEKIRRYTDVEEKGGEKMAIYSSGFRGVQKTHSPLFSS